MIRQAQWEELLKTGIELSSYKEVEILLEKIVSNSIRVAGCDGASIYIRSEDHLEFRTTHNTVLEKKLGNLKNYFQRFSIPISNQSISGYVACTKESLNIADVYQIPKSKPYQFLDNFDRLYDYRTVSMLTLPMLDNNEDLIGVLQLINSRSEDGTIKAFSEEDVFVAKYLSSIAAMAVKNASFSTLLKKSYLETVERLALASEFRDLETSYHIKRISEYSALLWRKLGHDEEEVLTLSYAAQMHDIGKIGIPDRILQKPGPLTPEERKIMEKHTIIGGKILENSSSELLNLSSVVALSHHEKWDGTGYPQGLKGEDIPFEGRVVAIADVFDALAFKRVYKPAFSVEKVFAIMKQEKGRHFDPELLKLFLDSAPEVLSIYEYYRE